MGARRLNYHLDQVITMIRESKGEGKSPQEKISELEKTNLELITEIEELNSKYVKLQNKLSSIPVFLQRLL